MYNIHAARMIFGVVSGLLGGALLAGQAQAAVGSTDASYGVTQNGAPRYTIPLRVTDGINGLTPDLAIRYAGPSARGILGVGFELSGISYVAPCPKTIAQDLAAAPVTLTSSDRYCLDGAKLRLLAGTGSYGASESQYRTELDQLVRITAKESANGIPGWFRVEMPDGLEYEYGNSANSKLLKDGTSGAPPQFWAVNKISDPSGNAIVFHYDTDSSQRRFRPDYISYTERAGSGHYRINFIYQSAILPEQMEEFTPSATGGAAHRENKLLERIELTHDLTVYRKILLTYQDGAAYNKRLASIQECVPGTPDDCLPSTSLTWASATAGHVSSVSSYAVAGSVIPLDINGDGFGDVAWASAGIWRYMLGSATGFSSVQSTGFAAVNPPKAMPLEWNGDGYWDLLIDWSDGKWRVLRGSASGFMTPLVHAGPSPGIPSNTVNTSWSIADLNGDGLDDLLSMLLNSGMSVKVRMNSPTGFGSQQTAFNQLLLRSTSQGFMRIDGTSAIARPDFNGDGRTDLLVYACDWDAEFRTCFSYGWYQLISQGTTFVNMGALPYASYTISGRFADFNGDGLTDLAYPAQTPGQWYLGFGQGGGGLAIVPGPSTSGYTNYLTLAGDYDGDGYHDFYAATSSSPQWHVFRGSPNGLTTSPIATGISATGNSWMLTDQTGDGLPDLGRYDIATFVWSTLPHAGVPGERLTSATDGLGNKVSFTYLPMTDSAVYTKGIGAVAPVIDVKFNASLVRTMLIEPAGGSSYFFSYKYADARSHTQGRGFLGMGKREITDSRNGMFTVETYEQDFPYIGSPEQVTVKQSASGNVIQDVTHTYANHLLDATSGNQRYLPYRSKTVTKAYEVGGIKNGLQITEITEEHTVNTLGNSTFVSLKFQDKDSGSAEFGSIWTTEVTSTFTENLTDWCIALPLTRSEKRILPGGVNETRAIGWQASTAQCRITQETLEPGGGIALSLVTDIGYDGCGNANSVSSYPAGTSGQQRTTAINYGTRCQRPESITNPENHVSEFAYDWPLALPSSFMDPNDVEVTLDYDGFGRLQQRNDPDDTDVVFSLTACSSSNGWCGKDSSVRLRATRSWRNDLDAVIRSEELFLDGFGRARWVHSDSLESGPAMIQTAFDAFGRPSAQSQPYFSGTLYSTVLTRDLIGRVTQINAPISESQPSGRITALAYEGRDLKITDPKSNVTTRQSNAFGQIRAVVDPSPGGITSYAYRPFGELASITDAANPANVTSWEYNERGFLKKTTDPDSGIWEYEHNAFGEMTKVRDAKTIAPAWTTQFSFDKLSRPLTRLEAEGTTYFTWGNSATTHNIGRLASVASPGSYQESYQFDDKGRLLQQNVVADGSTYVFNLTYAPSTGLLESLEYPASIAGYRLKLSYEYSNGLLKRVKNTNSPTVFWEAVSTDAFGHYQLENFGNGVQTFSDFDQASGLMQSREGGLGGGSGLIHSQVDWDLNGNLKQRIDHKVGAGMTEDFYYDNLNRFNYSERTPAGGLTAINADVTLDAIGNINWKLGVGSYAYHPTKKRAVIQAGSNSYGYDDNGNMNVRNGETIGYTSYNLPAVIDAPGNYSSTLSYGAFRNRYKQVAVGPQGTETTIYLAGLLEKVTRGSSIEYRHLIHGGQGTAAIHARRSSGIHDTYYLHRDHLGSPELITDSDGDALIRPSFAAYGERRDGSDWDGPIGSADLDTLADLTRRGFTGHEHLDAVGMIHMNGRVYEPVAGRFLSRDPFVDGLFSSQGINGYGYVHNNPLTLDDPSGFCGGVGEEPCRRIDGLSPGDTYRHRDYSPYQERGGRLRRTGADTATAGSIDAVTGGTGAMYGVDTRGRPQGNAGAAVLVVGAVLILGGVFDQLDKTLDKLADIIRQYEEREKTFATYVLVNPRTGQVYIGRTSGYDSPEQLVRKRYSGHTILRNEGFIIDPSAPYESAAYGDFGELAVRGREQQLIDYYGGPRSRKVRNIIRGVSKCNPAGEEFHEASDELFGNIADYTGDLRLVLVDPTSCVIGK